jgi:DNA-binding NtrC family response regulator
MAQTILLVDDEDALRRLAERLLTKLGYGVVVAGNGDAAVASLRDFPDEIHLLITDVFMPDISGPELATRLLAIRPGMKVLYVSGSNEALRDKGMLNQGANFLQKPYTQDDMREKIREILDR